MLCWEEVEASAAGRRCLQSNTCYRRPQGGASRRATLDWGAAARGSARPTVRTRRVPPSRRPTARIDPRGLQVPPTPRARNFMSFPCGVVVKTQYADVSVGTAAASRRESDRIATLPTIAASAIRRLTPRRAKTSAARTIPYSTPNRTNVPPLWATPPGRASGCGCRLRTARPPASPRARLGRQAGGDSSVTAAPGRRVRGSYPSRCAPRI